MLGATRVSGWREKRSEQADKLPLSSFQTASLSSVREPHAQSCFEINTYFVAVKQFRLGAVLREILSDWI